MSLTKKSKTLTGSATAEGGLGACGGASTSVTVPSRSGSGASSTYAFRGTIAVDSDILTDFFDLPGFSLYKAPWYFCASEMHD